MKVIHTLTTTAGLKTLDIVDGQVIVLWDGDAMYYDFNNRRHCVSGVENVEELPMVGDVNKLYINGNQIYRWDGVSYMAITSPIDDDTVSRDSTYSSEKIESFLSDFLSKQDIHVPDGVAGLDENGIVFEDQLPAGFRAVIHVPTSEDLPEVGDASKVYVIDDSDKIIRYDSESESYHDLGLKLGFTETTAYPGYLGVQTAEAVQVIDGNVASLITRIANAEEKIEDLQDTTRSLQLQIDDIPINYLLNVEDINDLEAALEILHKPSYNNGDILVLAQTGEPSNNRVFAYDEAITTWIPFASGGSVHFDADNIYFNRDILCAGEYTRVGNIEKPLYGTVTIPARNMSLAQVMDYIFTKELQPQIELPEVKIQTEPQDIVVEVGEEVAVDYETSVSEGKYTYDETTGVEILDLTVQDEDGQYVSHDPQGSFPPLPVVSPDGDEYELYRTSLKVNATIQYSDGDVAHTNMGNVSDPEVKITAGSASSTAKIYGHRSLFYGVLDHGEELTGELIRNKFVNVVDYEAQSGKTFTVDVSEMSESGDPVAIIIAVPSEGPELLQIGHVEAEGYFDPDITSSYELDPDTIDIEGANGFTAVPYDIWAYRPDLLYTDDIHHITLEVYHG